MFRSFIKNKLYTGVQDIGRSRLRIQHLEQANLRLKLNKGSNDGCQSRLENRIKLEKNKLEALEIQQQIDLHLLRLEDDKENKF